MTDGVTGYGTLQKLRSGLVAVALASASVAVSGQAPSQAPTFRGGVDLVTIRAVVRDGKGRPVMTLAKTEFELLDNGTPRAITAVEQDNGPIGVALLFDISGSMDVNDRYDRAREQGYFLLAVWGVNYGVVALLGVIVGLYIQNKYNPGLWSPMWLWLLPMPLLSFLLARHAKALFLAMDHYFDPHRKG